MPTKRSSSSDPRRTRQTTLPLDGAVPVETPSSPAPAPAPSTSQSPSPFPAVFDPVERTVALERVVCDGRARKYYRFRPARFYGGIITGDVVGCNLLCHFCWAADRVRDHPAAVGEFYPPQRAFDRLCALARKHGYRKVRLSGQEPTVGFDHLTALLELLAATDHLFILETNGIVIGAQPDRARALARFPDLHVRVSVKGTTAAEFTQLTGAAGTGFELQLAALEALVAAGVSCHPAVMLSFSSPESIAAFRHRLGAIDTALSARLEPEELVLYRHTRRRLARLGLDR